MILAPLWRNSAGQLIRDAEGNLVRCAECPCILTCEELIACICDQETITLHVDSVLSPSSPSRQVQCDFIQFDWDKVLTKIADFDAEGYTNYTTAHAGTPGSADMYPPGEVLCAYNYSESQPASIDCPEGFDPEGIDGPECDPETGFGGLEKCYVVCTYTIHILVVFTCQGGNSPDGIDAALYIYITGDDNILSGTGGNPCSPPGPPIPIRGCNIWDVRKYSDYGNTRWIQLTQHSLNGVPPADSPIECANANGYAWLPTLIISNNGLGLSDLGGFSDNGTIGWKLANPSISW